MPRLRNILLVYPEIPKNTYWSFEYALQFVNKKSAMPPLGLITIAAFFPETCRLRLVDMNIEPLDEADVAWADAVFVSAMIVQKESFEAVVATCNRLGKPVVAGGPYPTNSHEEITGVDHLVLGEAEGIMEAFLADFESGAGRYIYRSPERPDITHTRIPRFELLRMECYASMSVQYSRGCPFRCEFCDIWGVYGNRPRLKSAGQMIAELGRLKELGYEGPVFMVDDNFIGNRRRVKRELLPALIEWQTAHRHVFRFFTEASIDLADDEELMALMRDAGFNDIFIGLETPSLEGLKETGKNQNLKTDMAQAVRRIQSYGMEVMAGFILGFDSDTADIFERQIQFIQEVGIPKAMVGLLTALPGTQLYRRLEKEGRLKGSTCGNNTHHVETNFETRMPAEQLREGYKTVLATIYDYRLKNYFQRCNRLLDGIGETPFFQRKVHLAEVKMLLKSLAVQPFKPYGREYVKFLVRNLAKNRRFFPEAVRLGIQGHHFHTITQELMKVENLSRALEINYRYFSEQLRKYSSQTTDLSGSSPGPGAELWEECKAVLEDLRRKVNRIHGDFQAEASVKYQEFRERMQELFKPVELALKEPR